MFSVMSGAHLWPRTLEASRSLSGSYLKCLKVCLAHTWFMSVRSLYSSPVWSLPGAPWEQVRWSSGPWQSCASFQVVSCMLGPCQGMVTHGAMSDVSGEVLVLGQVWCPWSL